MHGGEARFRSPCAARVGFRFVRANDRRGGGGVVRMRVKGVVLRQSTVATAGGRVYRGGVRGASGWLYVRSKGDEKSGQNELYIYIYM